MAAKRDETRKKILEVTADLLNTAENPDEITIRQIAQAAGAGIGLINYYFVSKDNLFNEAIALRMESLAENMENMVAFEGDPLDYLKSMLIHMCDIAIKNRKLNKISIEYELLKGDFKICLYLLPILKKIVGDRKSETELRLIAVQIIVTVQSIYLRQEAFHMFTGINIESKAERDSLMDSIINNLLK